MDMELFWTIVRANGFCFMAVLLLWITGRSFLLYRQRLRSQRAMRGEPIHYVTGPVSSEPGRPVAQAVPPYVAAHLYLQDVAEMEPDLADQAETLMNSLLQRMGGEQREMLDQIRKNRASLRVGQKPPDSP